MKHPLTFFALWCIVFTRLSAQHLDTSFNSTGYTVFGSGETWPTALLPMSNGDVLTGRNVLESPGQSAAVTKINANGHLDKHFGKGGTFTFALDGYRIELMDMALYPAHDWRIALAGNLWDEQGIPQVFVARLRYNGQLDTTFNGTGYRLMGIVGQSVRAMAVTAQGEIVLGGSWDFQLPGIDADCFLLQLRQDGSNDPAFGVNGQVLTDFFLGDDTVEDLLLEPDGKITVCGKGGLPGTWSDLRAGVLTRYFPDGTLDPAFGSGGKTVFTPTNWTQGKVSFKKLVRQASGNYVANFKGLNFDGPPVAGLLRFSPDGTMDTTFGEPLWSWGNNWGWGHFHKNYNFGGNGLAFQDKHILLATGYPNLLLEEEMAVQRLDENGHPDLAFGDSSILAFDSGYEPIGAATQVAYDPFSGKIFLIGMVYDTLSGDTRIALARFNAGETTGVQEALIAPLQLSVWPNPADDFVEVALNGDPPNAAAQLVLYDLNGKMIRRAAATLDAPFRLSVADLSPGLYFLQVRAGEQMGAVQLIKK